ncbi:MAG: TIGR00268 family protein [Lentisphaerae bacterium GWF2_45_14]|nr:MAG: TIGR00268 family protein [Lentisphaerae bacterium GWF2_45_14]
MDKKIEKLSSIIIRSGRTIVLFSGGTDSAFLLKMCAVFAGPSNITAVTAVSESYTKSELENARLFAKGLNVEHLIIETSELSNPSFIANNPDRCYHCKKELFSKVLKMAAERCVKTIFDGTNYDDLSDYRPGRKAAAESGIISPLLDAGFTKEDVRKYSKEIGLETWDAVPNPCLASRIPYGNAITAEKLDAVRLAESFIRELGFRELRVRHHGETARIEVPPEEIPRICDERIRIQICQYLKELGFTWVSLDMNGYRRGSLNENIRVEGKNQ